MKQEYKQKLLVVFNNICNSIDKETTLYFSYRDFSRRCLSMEGEMPLEMWMQEHDDEQYLEGVYSPSAKAIYINPSSKWKNVKRGYSDYLYTLTHELTQWYFPSFKHGFKCEQKIGEIFKMIPKEEVYDKLPPWPMKNEIMSILCPRCQYVVTLFFDDNDDVWMFRPEEM